jgi:hypothetical protein
MIVAGSCRNVVWLVAVGFGRADAEGGVFAGEIVLDLGRRRFGFGAMGAIVLRHEGTSSEIAGVTLPGEAADETVRGPRPARVYGWGGMESEIRGGK